MFKHLFSTANIKIVNLSTDITKCNDLWNVYLCYWLDQKYLLYTKCQNAVTVKVEISDKTIRHSTK